MLTAISRTQRFAASSHLISAPRAFMSSASKKEKERLIIFDTTLRDGEQSPGATLNIEEKLQIAKQLSLMGVDVW